jgi:hypothetical protein
MPVDPVMLSPPVAAPEEAVVASVPALPVPSVPDVLEPSSPLHPRIKADAAARHVRSIVEAYRVPVLRKHLAVERWRLDAMIGLGPP